MTENAPLHIISGGQTGVDRAALDAAMAMDIPCSGWCPRGRLAEDGRIPDTYPLTETPSRQYGQRTEWNARDSDATLIFNMGPLSGGTAVTVGLARKHAKACLVIQLDDPAACRNVSDIIDWIHTNRIRRLNVAGPRASKASEIYLKTRELITRLIPAICGKSCRQ